MTAPEREWMRGAAPLAVPPLLDRREMFVCHHQSVTAAPSGGILDARPKTQT